METLPLLLAIGFFHALLYLADSVFRSWRPLPYLVTLRSLGIQISLGQVRWTTGCSQILSLVGLIPSRFTRVWFSVGSWLSSLFCLPCLLFLVYLLYQQLCPPHHEVDQIVLRPLLPGVNLPTSELPYYCIALVLTTVIHEAGHAMAAFNSKVRVLGIGLTLFLFLPAAFVDVDTSQLEMVGARAQLRVFSAGVWHNLVLGVAAWTTSTTLPTILSPLYFPALTVADVSQDSGVGGEAGLRAGDVLLAIQGRRIGNLSAYREVLASLIREGGGGLCVEPSKLSKPVRTSEGNSCCEEGSSGSLCFTRNLQQSDHEYHCLAVRPLLKSERLHCWDGDDGCENDNVCLPPLLEGNSSRLLIADRQNQRQLIFLGSPAELYQSVQMTEYSPRVNHIPIRLPDQIAKLLRYTFSISFGLALLNIVPCYLLDGHHIASAIISLLPVPSGTKHMATFALTSLGSALVALNLVIGLVAVVREGRLPL